jgi:hypothetical protein
MVEEGSTMPPKLSLQLAPELSAEQSSADLVQLILKLRQLGERAEADRLELAMRTLPQLDELLSLQEELLRESN